MTHQNSKITRLHERLLSIEKYILDHDRDGLQLAGILALQDKAYLALGHMDRIYFKINNILMLGDNHTVRRSLSFTAPKDGRKSDTDSSTEDNS